MYLAVPCPFSHFLRQKCGANFEEEKLAVGAIAGNFSVHFTISPRSLRLVTISLRRR